MRDGSVPPLPESFLFGVATADHQCESYDPGCEDIRDVWEQRRALTPRGKATDFWDRYPEDILLAKSLGCKAFRFSIAWSRVEPTPGNFDEKVFNHYRHLLQTIQEVGMEPIVTLHHFTWPIHVEARGGLIAPEFPAIYARYVGEVAKRLGNQARYWITFNEPSQLIYGYTKPWWEQAYFMPPGLPVGSSFADQMSAVSALMRNLFLAHTTARTVIKQVNPQAMVGVNPMLLGLPLWLQKLVDGNVKNLRSQENLNNQGKRFTERALVEHGDVDVAIAALTVTRDRENQVAFSAVYYTAHQTLLVKYKRNIHQLEDLIGRTVVVVKGTTAESTVRQRLPQTIVHVARDYQEALKIVDYDEVTALLGDDTALRLIMQQYPNQYRLTGGKLSKEPYAAAVAQGNQELLDAVNFAIQHSLASGSWTQNYAQYFPGQHIPQPPQLISLSLADTSSNTAVNSTPLPLAKAKTVLRRIQDRGYIVIGVREDMLGFGYRDPQTKKLSGLEIDLAKAVAQHIFGDSSKVVFYPVKPQQRISLVRSLVQILDPILKPLSILSTSLTTNWWHLGMAGQLPTFLCPAECIGQQDFVGFDYYWGIRNLGIHRIQQLMDAAFGRFNRAPVWPGVLYDMLKFHAQLFPDKEILIIENGSVDIADGIDRATYLRQHIREVQRAHHHGVKVAGYVCWSITSNREWGLKFNQNSDFGLYHIELDRDKDLKRIPTPAAQAYQEIIHNRGI